MSEKENFDEKLANKFREAFDNYEADYQPADWTKLQANLHKSPFTSIWRNRYASHLAVAAGVAVLFVSYFIFKEKVEISTNTKVQYAKNKQVDSVKIEQKEQASKPKVVPNLAETKESKSEQKHEANKEVSVAIPTPVVVQTDEKQAKKQLEKQGNIPNEAKIQIAKNQLLQSTDKKMMIIILPIAAIQADSFALAYEIPKTNSSIDLTLKGLTKNKAKKVRLLPLTFGLAANPLVYQNNIDRNLSIETGLNVSIPLANRLKLTTGLLIAPQNMQYRKEKSLSREFVFATDTSKSLVGVSSLPRENVLISSKEMSNNLLIINIPINLQYDFWYGQKFRLFASVGVTNYTYLNEKYVSNNIDSHLNGGGRPNFPPTMVGNFPPPNMSNYNVVSESKHSSFSQVDLLSSLSLSAGIAYQMSSHFSIQASPFIRLPMGGIGREKLTFNTFGLALVVNYH